MIALLATSEVVRPHAALSVVAALAALLGLAVYVAVRVATRPRRVPPGPSSQDLGPEPPAVVDLLVGGFAPDDDAIAATLVDLAARGFVDIFDSGPDNVVVQVRRVPPGSVEALAPYERRVLDHLSSLGGDGGAVPADALTTGPQALSQRWRRDFAREVIADARSRGLCRPRWTSTHVTALWAALVVTGVLAWAAYDQGDRTDSLGGLGAPSTLAWGLSLLGATVLLVVAMRISASDAQRDTDAGLAAAARWTGVGSWYRSGNFAALPASSVAVWDRHLAYATAMGAAPTVDRQLNFEAEHDTLAWSSYGGVFRRVVVRYRSWRPGWGMVPWLAVVTGAVQTLILGSFLRTGYAVANAQADLMRQVAPDAHRTMSIVSLVVAVILVPATVHGLARALMGLVDLVRAPLEIDGQVVRARVRRSGGNSSKQKTTYHLAIDDGTTDRITTLRVDRRTYVAAPQGTVVRARVSPLLGHVSDLRPAVPSSDAPPPVSGVDAK
ncbi:MAG: DUF2207 family protein [Acidimicrobiales bacterium]